MKTAPRPAGRSDPVLGRCFLLRVPKGADLHGHLLDFCRRRAIRAAWVHAIGATHRARLGYYDRRRRKYSEKEFRGALELLSCTGNVSLKDGRPFAHLHAVLGDSKYHLRGGHLCSCEVFAAEVRLQEISGDVPRRVPDPETGLFLWGGGKI